MESASRAEKSSEPTVADPTQAEIEKARELVGRLEQSWEIATALAEARVAGEAVGAFKAHGALHDLLSGAFALISPDDPLSAALEVALKCPENEGPCACFRDAIDAADAAGFARGVEHERAAATLDSCPTCRINPDKPVKRDSEFVWLHLNSDGQVYSLCTASKIRERAFGALVSSLEANRER